MRSSSEIFDISAHTRKLDVDNRYSLQFYLRIADNILRQADIFLAEKNIIDLYVMLIRYTSLVFETIPRHRDYWASPQNIKDFLRKKSLNALSELEKLKPAVQLKVKELNAKHVFQVNGQVKFDHKISSVRTPTPTLTNYDLTRAAMSPQQGLIHQGSRTRQPSLIRPVEAQFHRLSLGMPRPKEETLSRHSIFGPNGLYGKWRPPKTQIKVQYPSNIDLRPVEIPSILQSLDNGPKIEDISGNQEPQESTSISESYQNTDNQINKVSESYQNTDNQINKVEEPGSLISFETTESETFLNTNVVRQPSPPPVLAEVQELVPTLSPQMTEEKTCGKDNTLHDLVSSEKTPLQLHISTAMMDSFMKLAKSNTNKNLETCGILGGILKDRKFFVTALIIPKQESTSDSCQATNEEEIFEVQDKRELFPLGWIHTHPTQSCFMSSIDVHTHYAYQTMLPQAVAIVMAPKDSLRTHGIFRLTTPGGMSVIRNCQQRGFHPHEQPPDGGPIYNTCTDVYMNPKLKFDVIDLR